MRPLSLLQWLLFLLLPAVFITSIAVSTVWGEHGLMARHRLKADLAEAGAQLAAVERENERLLRDLELMDRDPVVLERLVAEELSWGRPDAVLYRFEPAGAHREAAGP